MPLLGRLKSSGSSGASNQRSSKSKSPPVPAPAPNDEKAQVQSQVCESPLFGLRREIPLWSGLQQAQAQVTQQAELSSVPQEISKQQIHYAFSMMDTNKDGLIDLHDLSQMLANLGLPIDKAILAHIMSSVSKRGDNKMREGEFLAWLSNFIQVKDSTVSTKKQPLDPHHPGASKLEHKTFRQAPTVGTGTGARSFTGSSSSLIAQIDTADATARNTGRRGSGSGLVLMRSLSSSSVCGSSDSKIASPHKEPRSGKDDRKLQRSADQVEHSANTLDLEARNDLKAAFCVFDLDGDGFITLDEVRAGLRLLGESSWSALELNHLFSRCSSAPPSTSSAKDLSRQQQQQQQRISIDDFVQLLL